MTIYKHSLKIQSFGKNLLFSAQPAYSCQEGDPGISVDGALKISP